MADIEFKTDSAGFIELCTSAEMSSLLLDAASQMAASANSAASDHVDALHISSFKVQPYVGAVTTLSRTCVGYVTTASYMGRLDEQKFSTLSAQNH